jgi:hypothetical protein
MPARVVDLSRALEMSKAFTPKDTKAHEGFKISFAFLVSGFEFLTGCRKPLFGQAFAPGLTG